MKITEAVQGSGYWDLHLGDNSWQRVDADALPSGYEPQVGDTLDVTDGTPAFIPAPVVEEQPKASPPAPAATDAPVEQTP